MTRTRSRRWLALALVLLLAAGIGATRWVAEDARRIYVTAYFDNSNGIYPGDEVRVLGVRVGEIESIEPQPDQAKIVFWYDASVDVPADAAAVILSPSLVTARAIQLTPVYTGGPVLTDRATIPVDRTAVPVEWDDFRVQLEKLTDSLQPTAPGEPSPLGQVVSTTAANLRGQGSSIRETVIEMAQAFSTLGDHSQDIYGTLKNLAMLTSALQSSGDLMSQLNRNLAGVTASLTNSPDEISRAAVDLRQAIEDVHGFVADNKDTLDITADRMASLSTALEDSSADIKQLLHVAPSTLQNYANIYQPAQSSLSGVVAVNNFANPITFLCGAIQAASRLGAEQSAKLCAQYLAPIVKNRQYNFPPLGMNPFVGTQARPNEVTYSEDWMRPDHRPQPVAAAPPAPAEAAPVDPAAGLAGLMVPGGGS
ncbi:MCE family protein [Mycolicibacterium vaccae]|uniref:MCE family protein n=1 Tax=Mycolicibacterium vaccae TaxID=1810 RepID=UPI003D087701